MLVLTPGDLDDSHAAASSCFLAKAEEDNGGRESAGCGVNSQGRRAASQLAVSTRTQ